MLPLTPLPVMHAVLPLAPALPAMHCRVSKVNPAGTLPVIKDLGLDSWVVDSDTISGGAALQHPSKLKFIACSPT